MFECTMLFCIKGKKIGWAPTWQIQVSVRPAKTQISLGSAQSDQSLRYALTG